MVGSLCRARFSNAVCVRAVLLPACGLAAWLQGSQSAAALAPLALGGTPHQAGADAMASGPPNTVEEGALAPGLAVGPTGPTGFATAYANNYSCASEMAACNVAALSSVSCATATSCEAVGTVGNSQVLQGPLGEGWNGTSWTIQPPPPPSTLTGVSCTLATACMAA